MTLRTGHGNGRGVPRIEVLPVDELPRGVTSPTAPPDDGVASALGSALREGADTVAARELGRLGGLAKAARDRGLRGLIGLGLKGTPPEFLAPYLSDAEAFAVCEIKTLAANVGGGICGPTPSSIVQTAALQLAGSRAAFASGDMVLGSRLGNDSRQNLLAAHELAAKEALARPRESPRDRIAREIAEANRGRS